MAMPRMCTDWIVGIAQVLCSWMNTLGDVVASHSAKSLTTDGDQKAVPPTSV